MPGSNNLSSHLPTWHGITVYLILFLQSELTAKEKSHKEGQEELHKLTCLLESRDEQLASSQEKEDSLKENIVSAQNHAEKLQVKLDEQGKPLITFL